jgi:hypothetical protein
MANGSTKPGDALADKARDEFDRNRRERELAIARLEIRAEQRSAPDIEEDTGVIHREALERQARREPRTDPPSGHAQQGVALVRSVKTWQQTIVALALIALLALIAWLKLR